MAVRKTGLGKGLDGLFPSYVEKPASKEKKSGKKEKTGTKGPSGAGKASVIEYDEVVETTAKQKKTTSSSVRQKKTTAKDNPKDNITESVADIAQETEQAKEMAEPETQENIADTTEKKAYLESDLETNEVTNLVDINKVEPNRNQPRRLFDEDSLNELAESISLYGIISPVIVADKGDYYEIIAGERRWRAARIAGLKEIPVIIRDYDKQKVLEISLIENIQREDLNAIDEAMAFKRLSEEFSLTQDEVSARVSKSRSAITNSLRLLKLDQRVQDMVRDDKISSGHARALLAISDPDRQYEMAMHVFDQKLSVREVEKLIKTLSRQPKERKKPTENTAMDIICREMEDRMKSVLGTKVSVTRKNEKRGKIEIEYYSTEELERIYELLSSIS